jgi:hypothetical protein
VKLVVLGLRAVDRESVDQLLAHESFLVEIWFSDPAGPNARRADE